jgi:hypothetical protein
VANKDTRIDENFLNDGLKHFLSMRAGRFPANQSYTELFLIVTEGFSPAEWLVRTLKFVSLTYQFHQILLELPSPDPALSSRIFFD